MVHEGDVDKFLSRAMVYHDGVKVDGMFYTFEELEKHIDELLERASATEI